MLFYPKFVSSKWSFGKQIFTNCWGNNFFMQFYLKYLLGIRICLHFLSRCFIKIIYWQKSYNSIINVKVLPFVHFAIQSENRGKVLQIFYLSALLYVVITQNQSKSIYILVLSIIVQTKSISLWLPFYVTNAIL